MRLAPSLRRLGEALVSCYLLEEAGEVTVIDAGVPACYSDLSVELAAMGRTVEDVRGPRPDAWPRRPHRLRGAPSCRMDPMAAAMGARFDRTETLAQGGQRCDFRFSRGEPVHVQPEFQYV